MSQEDEKDIEPVIDKKKKEPEQFGTRKAFKNLPRDLSPDDLNNSCLLYTSMMAKNTNGKRIYRMMIKM